MMKNKTLTTLIAAALGAATLTGCAANTKMVKQTSDVDVPTYNKNKSQKFKTKGDFIENVFEYDDANKDGKYDTIRKIYFADRNEDGVTDLVHFQLFKNEGVFKKPLMTQAMMIDDDYDGIADRIIADKDGDNNYDSQLFIGIRLDPDGLFFLFF